MHKGRLEAFSDGVIAIIITIMVLELKVPHASDWESLQHLWPVFLSYVLSFIYIGIYWNNHHHMFQAANKVNGSVLWANLHLLFWLSLVPFGSGWVGENGFASLPVAVYGIILLFAAIAYYVLTLSLVAHHGKDSAIAKAVGNDFKGKISLVFYAVAIPVAFWNSWVAYSFYILVALIWLVPDKRMEKALSK